MFTHSKQAEVFLHQILRCYGLMVFNELPAMKLGATPGEDRTTKDI